MSDKWYSRTVLFVSNINTSVDFYVKQLGFQEKWRFEDGAGEASVAQVARPGLELILAAESPETVGKVLEFISLDEDVLKRLRTELEARGVEVKDGTWGYHVMAIADPDGNAFYFPYEGPLEAKGTLKRF